MNFRFVGKKILNPILLLFLSVLLVSCQTSMIHQFNLIKPGMEKDSVLSLMGSPNQSHRFHGKDRWLYSFYEDKIRYQKEVQFFEGKAVYSGDVLKSTPAAEEKPTDVNVFENENILNALAEKVSEQQNHNLKQMNSNPHNEKKIRYLPAFEPIQ